MLESSSRLGPYEIVGPLGAGGMGEVYRARDTRLGREVAVKVLAERFSGDVELKGRFEREAQAVAALSHPNILAIHDFGTQGSSTYAVMELLEGQTLRERLNRGPMPWRKVVEIGVAIAEGLAAAHAKGITHRDLKPENLFLTSGGSAKILDFGLAQVQALAGGLDETSPHLPRATEAGTVLGTVGYMAPEQVRGQTADVRSDIFSLGCVLHEMVTGKRAFARDTAVETMTAILHDDPAEVAESGKNVPLEVERVIGHCLEKSRDERFQSARDLAFALKAVLSNSNASNPSVPAPPAARSPLAFRIIAACAFLGLTFGTAALIDRMQSVVKTNPASQTGQLFESVAVLPFENVTGNPRAEPISDGIADHLSISLSQLRDRDFKVTPFTSASRFRGPKIDLKAAGRALGVQGVVTGKLYEEEETLSISVALSDARADNLIWGQQYRGKRSEILVLQDEIAKGLVAHLGLRLSDADERRLLKRHTEDPTAYVLYQEGMYHWHKFSEESTRTAIDYFLRATKIDPQFALAYEGLGRCYGLQSPSRESYPKAKEAYEQALKLDGSLAEAHGGMGNFLMFYDHNWPAAESALKEALRLNPRLADAHHLYGFYLAAMGQATPAVAELKTAKELDPQTAIRFAGLALVHFMARQYEQQLAESQKMLELAPNFPLAYLNLGEAYALQGKYEQAVQAFQKQLALDKKNTASFGLLGYTYARWGKRAEAEKVIQDITDLSQQQYFSGFERARIYAGLGENDQAFIWLEKAYEERDWGMAWLKVDPTLDSLRSDPHFSDLLLRLGLADRAATPDQGIQSVAVLPLENVGADPKTEFLSDGIADQIISSLLQVRRQNLKVRPFTSVARYKLQKPDLRTIARDLNVQAIVTGSLRQQGDVLSIGIELVDAREDNVLWNKRYPPCKLSEILDLQDQIARDVAANLRLRLTGEEEQRLTKHYTANPRAYLLYREGVFHLNKFTPEGLQIGIEYFRRALEVDPNYASALVGVGRCKVLLGTLHLGPKATQAEARDLLSKALKIDNTVADAHAGLGAIHLFHDWDWPAAERELKQAIGTEVSAPFTWNIYGFYLASQGRLTEALESIRRGQQIDPLAAPRTHEMAMCYVWMRQYDQAIAESKKALQLDPNFLSAYAELSKALAEKGTYDEAISELRMTPSYLHGSPLFLGQLGYAYAMAGRRAEAEEVVQELKDPAGFRFGCSFGIATIQAALGEKDQAFEWLEKACEERHPRVIWLKVDPTWDNLRSDLRFAQLLKDMRLPP